MSYRTVYDISQVGLQWWIPLLMFMFASLFVGIGWAVRTLGDPDSPGKGRLFQVIGSCGILFAIGFFASMYREYERDRKALASHAYSVSEGVVSEFVPMPPGGHAKESFTVSGVHFEYIGGWGSTAFGPEWNKGLIHDGVQARITYVGEDILKVEIK